MCMSRKCTKLQFNANNWNCRLCLDFEDVDLARVIHRYSTNNNNCKMCGIRNLRELRQFRVTFLKNVAREAVDIHFHLFLLLIYS